MELTFVAPMWVYHGKGAWFFVTVPKETAEQIKFFIPRKRGWGAVRVTASIGGSTWHTSLFPDSKTGSYVLPVKAEIRKKESIGVDDKVRVILAIEPTT